MSTNFLKSGERILKIGQHLPKLWTRIKVGVFSEHSVHPIYPMAAQQHKEQAVREAGTIRPHPGLQVDNIFVFIHQVVVLFRHDNIFVFIRQTPVPACWLFKTSATS